MRIFKFFDIEQKNQLSFIFFGCITKSHSFFLDEDIIWLRWDSFYLELINNFICPNSLFLKEKLKYLEEFPFFLEVNNIFNYLYIYSNDIESNFFIYFDESKKNKYSFDIDFFEFVDKEGDKYMDLIKTIFFILKFMMRF